jgi:ferredoxin-NADP reductase/Na+-translocating ferredoxin:NAD+ oxidoreductase RnfD subunit
MMNYLDNLLDSMTMYRLLLYYLLILVGAAMLFGALGYLPYSPEAILAEASFITLACWLINKIFGYVYEATTNAESSLLTGLILTLIITPPASTRDFLFYGAASGLAVASKYILAIRKKHIFNPAAIAVVLTAFGAGQSASWWVGATPLLPLVVLGGVLLARRIQRFQMIITFIVAALVASATFNLLTPGSQVLPSLQDMLLHSSLFFLAFVMLTEPMTSPVTLANQRWYAILAGVLFPPQVHLGAIYTTPELVLVITNVFAYVVSPKVRIAPRLRQLVSWGSYTQDFIFTSDRKFAYEPGQYMEWSLPHHKQDARGMRRYFTLASSPTENNIRIGVRFYPEGSSFKRTLQTIDANTRISATHLGGDFVLPKDSNQKLAFIAGGIGVTPFRSMVKYLVDTNDKRSIALVYSERTANDIAYSDVFTEAQQKLGANITYTLTTPNTPIPAGMRAGFITPELIAAQVPDYRVRLFYVSGPPSMVKAVKSMLRSIGVAEHNLKTDFFPGYSS